MDAVDAPVWGIVFDKTHSRWGKSRPWFLWLCVPFAIFGVLTFLVRERTRELGIRVALGATAGDILQLVLRAGLTIAGTGIALGLAAAAILTRTLASLLFGVTPLDPVTFIAAPAVLAATVLVAASVPAMRAIRVDPAVTLRQE